ncbi:MAG: hypothetical protein ACP5C4_08115 [Methanomicrobiales archaeon]
MKIAEEKRSHLVGERVEACEIDRARMSLENPELILEPEHRMN